jgi:hypothetical protein
MVQTSGAHELHFHGFKDDDSGMARWHGSRLPSFKGVYHFAIPRRMDISNLG